MSFHVIHACAPVCCSLSVSPHPSFYFLVLFLFQLYPMSNSAPDEFSMKIPCATPASGAWSLWTMSHPTHLVSYTRTPNRTMHGKTFWDRSNHHRNTETLTESTVSQWNSSGVFSKDAIRCRSVKKSSLLLKLRETPENFTGRIIFMSMFNDISCGSKRQ